MAVMVPLVFFINDFTKHDWKGAFFFATAVAVGLTPEMLPMVVSVCLAKGALATSRRKVIVKRLNSIQNFGGIDVLCTDKSGTLTEDRVVPRIGVTTSSPRYSPRYSHSERSTGSGAPFAEASLRQLGPQS
jgi:Mg2+-importing ATPase